MRNTGPLWLALGGLQACAAWGQASFDTKTQVLTVPTIDVAGQTYRDLKARLDPDGRLTILALTPPGPDLATRIQAAASTAQSRVNSCAPIQPFYWEIGDKAQRLAGGSVNAAGSGVSYDASTAMSIASASKWLYGAYVAERRGGALSAEDIQFLNFRSGYTNFPFSGCNPGDSVASCVARGSNGVQTPAYIGSFFYSGGHMEKHASLPAPGMALGALDNTTLANEMRRVLGTEIDFSYTQPQLAGGVRTSARDYAVFLRKLLNNQLKLSTLLGSNPVCTNPATCAAAVYSPTPTGVSWHYSLGHWVEDDPASGDGAFSSAGAFGFYPWIDAGKSHYGIVARVDLAGSGFESAACGAQIRGAWLSGIAQ
ncbi:MAG: hypothetical protein HY021_15485 [Burkholderiales bacterium]|nr:hypothetical protein [Burkholderiales bacterium]